MNRLALVSGPILVASFLVVAPTRPCPAQDAFRRGDANADGSLDLADALALLHSLFLAGQAPPCSDAGDVNDSGDLDVGDVVLDLFHLYVDRRPLPAPFPGCGPDPSADGLDCGSFPPCAPDDADTDNDGLTDAEELARGTDPRKPDTDGDGIPDGAEVRDLGTDPLARDSDGGGSPDGVEIARGDDPLDRNDDRAPDPVIPAAGPARAKLPPGGQARCIAVFPGGGGADWSVEGLAGAEIGSIGEDPAFCGFEGIRKHRKRGRPPAARGFSRDPSQPGMAASPRRAGSSRRS